jgi:hypothetical protein
MEELMETSDYLERLSKYAKYVKVLHSALEFAQERIKSGKAWDAECEKVFDEALRPKGWTFYERTEKE